MEFTRAAQVIAGILFHSSIMTSRSCWMLDTWCFSTFRLRMPHMCSIGFRSGDILVHSITFSFNSKAVVILAVCLGWLCWKTVSEGRASSSASECHSTCWNPCFPQWTAAPSTSSTHAAPDYDATTTMLDCRQGTIFLVLLTRASPHMLDTIWAKQVYHRLIRPQDMVPVGVFDLKHGYRQRSTRVAACSQGRGWKRTCQAGHFLLPLVTLTRCLHTLSQMKWIKCNICQIHRRFRNVFMSNRNTFYVLLNTGPSVQE